MQEGKPDLSETAGITAFLRNGFYTHLIVELTSAKFLRSLFWTSGANSKLEVFPLSQSR